MEHHDVMAELNSWDAQESFYRSWHSASTAERSALLADPSVPLEYRDIVRSPLSIDPLSTEERFFASDRNVQVIKHPRYIPYFEHRHDFFELIYLLTGSCSHTVGGLTSRLVEGDACLVAPGVTHGIEVMDDSVAVNILMRTSTFMDVFSHAVCDRDRLSGFFLGGIYGLRADQSVVFHTGGDERIRRYVLEMYAEQAEGDACSDRIVCSLLTVMLALIVRGHLDGAETMGETGTTAGPGMEMVAYVVEHVTDVSLADIARHFHYSEAYCSKAICSTCGTTFSDLVATTRLRRACELLQDTQLGVADIAYTVGYRSPETFIRAFRRKYGCTPGRYRRET